MHETSRFLRVRRLSNTVLVAMLAALFIPSQPAAAAGATHHHYKLLDFGTFGGPQSYTPVSGNELLAVGMELNNSGVLVDFADTLTPDRMRMDRQPAGAGP